MEVVFFFYNIPIITNFLAIFLLVSKFSLLDPDPGGKLNVDPCEFGSKATLKYGGFRSGFSTLPFFCTFSCQLTITYLQYIIFFC